MLPGQPKDYDRFLQSERRHCDDIDGGGEVCLTMVPDSLCSRLHSDHNFYAICTEFLDPWNEGPWPGGGCLLVFVFSCLCVSVSFYFSFSVIIYVYDHCFIYI